MRCCQLYYVAVQGEGPIPEHPCPGCGPAGETLWAGGLSEALCPGLLEYLDVWRQQPQGLRGCRALGESSKHASGLCWGSVSQAFLGAGVFLSDRGPSAGGRQHSRPSLLSKQQAGVLGGRRGAVPPHPSVLGFARPLMWDPKQ